MERKIYEEIINRGCCKRCALRYLYHHKDLLTFECPNTSLVNLGIIPFGEEFDIEPPSKLKKENPCAVCLGVLQDQLVDEAVSSPKLTLSTEYAQKTFICYITFPVCVLLRDHSLKIHLKRLFPEYFKDKDIMKINHAWRHTVEKKMEKILGKKYNGRAKFAVHVSTEYPLEDDEMSVIRSFPNYKQHDASRHYLNSILSQIPDEEFCRVAKTPPRIPQVKVTLKDVKCFSEPAHIMGNYRKYSRGLPQLSCGHQGESVEEIIAAAFRSVVGSFASHAFSASGFDDHSVRVLGGGRTFHLQINDPRFESIPQERFRRIGSIVKKSEVAAVRNLEEVDKRDVIAAMCNEKLSPRAYKILCLVYKCKNINYCLNAVNMYSTLLVHQKTPIRALWQKRPYKEKTKKIFYMKAKKVGDNLLELEVCVECGLFLHEWVSGEFGRTTPSLSEIMKAKAEVLAVDLIDLSATVSYAIEEHEVDL